MKKTIISLVLTVCLIMAFAGMTLASDYPSGPITMIAPSGAGGGWDTTIRSVAKVLEDQDLVDVPLPVVNKSGAGGGIALSYLQDKEGEAKNIVVYSPPLLLINLTGQTPYSYKDLTPIAKLIEDYGIFAVADDSKYENIDQVMEQLKEDPGSITIAGASSPGSMDHIQFLIAAKAAGVTNLDKINYISFQEGEGIANVLGGHIDMISTGLAEVVGLLESGDVRGLAVTSKERIETSPLNKVPTLKEEGIDATFVNWRGLFGPPNMPEEALNFWRNNLKKMVKTDQWNQIAKNNGWNKAFMEPDEFSDFLKNANEDYKGILSDIGMLAE